MDPAFWLSKWEAGQIGFHRSEIHPDLKAHLQDWLGPTPAGVLVPLCGKSVDLPWLAERVPTTGVELAAQAVEELHQEQALQADVDDLGPFRRWRTGGLTVLQGDIFDLRSSHLGPVDRVWDRAAMVALDPARRSAYVRRIRELLPSGGRVLLNVLHYDPAVMPGPPHSISDEEVRGAYDGADIVLLDVDETLPEPFAERGHRWWHRRLYLITV